MSSLNTKKVGHEFKAVALSTMLTASSFSLTGCGYNKLQVQDETINEQWAQVVNEYKSRSELIPQLVEVTKKYASHEEEVLTQVAQARSQISGLKVTKEVLNDPEAMNQYMEAQKQMDSALSRLMAVSENYPELKANEIFLSTQDNLMGIDRRVTVARRRYIESVSEYNKTVRKFPTNVTAKVFGMDTKANFSVDNEAEISTAPKVDLSDDK